MSVLRKLKRALKPRTKKRTKTKAKLPPRKANGQFRKKKRTR